MRRSAQSLWLYFRVYPRKRLRGQSRETHLSPELSTRRRRRRGRRQSYIRGRQSHARASERRRGREFISYTATRWYIYLKRQARHLGVSVSYRAEEKSVAWSPCRALLGEKERDERRWRRENEMRKMRRAAERKGKIMENEMGTLRQRADENPYLIVVVRGMFVRDRVKIQ